MRKTPGAAKAHGYAGYCKHLRRFGKRLANKAFRRTQRGLKHDDPGSAD